MTGARGINALMALIMLELCIFTFPIGRRKHGQDRGQAGGRRLFLHQGQIWVATDLHANDALRG